MNLPGQSSSTPTGTLKKLFVSYSRSELYFTEAIVDALSDHYDVWFDLQQLLPGVDWKDEINRGLGTCDALVLICSQSALHSPNVANEWETALARDVPIVLVVTEAVDFTPYSILAGDNERLIPLDKLLGNAAVLDFRVAFTPNVNRLLNLLSQQLGTAPAAEPVPRDPINLHQRVTVRFRGRVIPDFDASIKVPKQVAFVRFALVFNLAIVLVLWVTRLSRWWQTSLVSAILVALLVNQACEFVSRRFRYNQVRWTMAVSAVSFAYLLLGWWPIALAEFVICSLAALRMGNSLELLRWAPRGEGPDNLRRKAHGRQRLREQQLVTPR